MLSQLSVETIDYKFDDLFKKYGVDANDQIISEVLEQMDKFPRESISFELHDIDRSIANGIRKCVLSEVEGKALHLEFEDIDCDDDFLLYEELQSRIMLIPLAHDCPEGTTFKLKYHNNTDMKVIIYSDSIRASDGKQYFNGRYPVFELHPDKHLNISNIIVSVGSGKQDAKYSYTNKFDYEILDYSRVRYLHEKMIVTHTCKTSDLLALMKKKKIKYDSSEGYMRILIVFNPAYTINFDKEELDFYTMIENNEYTDNEHDFLPWYQSATIDEKHFRLGFRTLGNIGASHLVITAINSLIDRIVAVRDNMLHCLENDVPTFGNVSIKKYNDLLELDIYNEKFTLGYMIFNHIMKLYPKLSVAVLDTGHYFVPNITIKVENPKAIDIVQNTCSHVENILRELVSAL